MGAISSIVKTNGDPFGFRLSLGACCVFLMQVKRTVVTQEVRAFLRSAKREASPLVARGQKDPK